MSQRYHSSDLSGEMIILGSGTSVGVPAVGCQCDVCRSGLPRNRRSRCAVAIGMPGGNLLIDTPPDLRTQLLREDIGIVHAVLYTHEHADHLHGLDDVRLFPFYLGHPVPLYCEEFVEKRIKHCFDYAFSASAPTHAGATPQLTTHRISPGVPLELLGGSILPVRLNHGPRFKVLGFRIGNVAYCTDTNEIPETSMRMLEGLDVLILDALRSTPHVSHFSLDEAIAVSERLTPKQTVFTHLSHDFDYDTVNAMLPETMELAYDGMRIPVPVVTSTRR